MSNKKLFNDPTVFFDVDETLVLWGKDYGKSNDPEAKIFHLYGSDYRLVPHYKHVDLLKDFKQQGYKIIVWSAAGENWAKEVVNKLNLEKYVDHCLSKPEYFVDDKLPQDFLHLQCRIYYPPEEKNAIINLKDIKVNKE